MRAICGFFPAISDCRSIIVKTKWVYRLLYSVFNMVIKVMVIGPVLLLLRFREKILRLDRDTKVFRPIGFH